MLRKKVNTSSFKLVQFYKRMAQIHPESKRLQAWALQLSTSSVTEKFS
jgi:hypothetical protein